MPCSNGGGRVGTPTMDRRAFLRVSGTIAGGMLIAVTLPRGLYPRGTTTPWQANAFVRIDADGTVTIIVPRPDMGQGVRTSLAAIVADELDADWSRVTVEQADYAVTRYGDQYSGGSSSVRRGWEPLGQAGATARLMLVQAAAARWSVPASECTTAKSEVVHAASGRRLSYGALAAEAATLVVPANVPTKSPDRYTLIGTAIPSVDAPAIVRGAMRFGLDQRVPGMLYAAIERAPTLGAKIARVEDAKARAVHGVRDVVRVNGATLPSFGEDNPRPPDGVAVVATSTWAALKGRGALAITWTPGAGAGDSTTQMRAQALALSKEPPQRVARDFGNVDAGMARAAKIVEATYEQPLLSHAQMEPMGCLADVRDGRCTVWAPIQNPSGAHRALERALGLQGDAITVHVVRSGGGFGRRFYADHVVEAALVSRAARAPVLVTWTREDDMRHGFYRPTNWQTLRAGLDAGGNVLAWSHHLVGVARGEFLEWELPKGSTSYPAMMGEYDSGDFPAHYLADFRITASRVPSQIPLGQWRAVDSSTSIFALEAFFDEVARAAGRDPVEMKLAMLAKPVDPADKLPWDPARLSAVLKLAAERGDWGKPVPTGRGRGIACAYANHAYTAEVADVTVGANGAVTVDRVVVAMDAGRIVNRSGAETQASGGVVYGLSAAMLQKITVEKGAVQQGNFSDFPTLRMRDTPRVEVHFIEPPGVPPSGIGEGALPCAAPAVTNAIFAATGKRVRTLPISL